MLPFFSASSLSYFLMLPSDIWLKAYFPFSLFSFGKQGTGTFFKDPVTAMMVVLLKFLIVSICCRQIELILVLSTVDM